MLVMTLQLPRLPRRMRLVLMAALAVVTCGCAGAQPVTTAPAGPPPQIGVASYYAHQHDGRRTASGEIFDMDAMTAAHPTLPFGTRARVTNLKNGRSVVVRINDRGPFLKNRVIDLSYAAAQELKMLNSGTARVQIDILPATAD